MRFLVSQFGDDDPPCRDAVLGGYVKTERHRVPHEHTPATFAALFKRNGWRPWKSLGENHRVEDGCIVRDVPDTGWFVELETLEQLMAFASEYAVQAIEPASVPDCLGHSLNVPTIEIDGVRG